MHQFFTFLTRGVLWHTEQTPTYLSVHPATFVRFVLETFIVVFLKCMTALFNPIGCRGEGSSGLPYPIPSCHVLRGNLFETPNVGFINQGLSPSSCVNHLRVDLLSEAASRSADASGSGH